MFLVFSVSKTWRDTTSDFLSNVFKSFFLAPYFFIIFADTFGSEAKTFIPKARAYLATIFPNLPNPISPRVFPRSWCPAQLLVRHFPLSTSSCAQLIFRNKDKTKAMVSSAVDGLFFQKPL